MDGENHGKPYEQMDDLWVFPYFWFNTHIYHTFFMDFGMVNAGHRMPIVDPMSWESKVPPQEKPHPPQEIAKALISRPY